MHLKWIGTLLLSAVVSTTWAQSKPFEGVELTVMTFDGPQVAEPLKRRGKEFEALTGAKLTVKTVPFAQLYNTLMRDWGGDKPTIDAAIMVPQWSYDFINAGLLWQLDDAIREDRLLRPNDIAPYFSAFSQRFKYRTYLMTLDGDFHLLYYRKDIFVKLGLRPPETWEDYIAAAQAAHGKDFGDGAPVVGSCIAKKAGTQSYWMIYSIAGGYLQSKGTQEGAFFHRGDLKPLVNNPGFEKALNIYKTTLHYGPPAEAQMDVGDTRKLFVKGGCAMTLDWGDIGPLAADIRSSKVVDRVGTLMLPGAREVLDRGTGKLMACDTQRCPYMINGVNRAPYAASGGWSGGVSAKSDTRTKEAAYALFSYMSQTKQSNVDVANGATGFNPYRLSQMMNTAPWISAGMSKEAAEDYLKAIEQSLLSPNMVLDLRIPGNNRYQQNVLDGALAKFIAGETTATTMKSIETQWNQLTDELGRAQQLKAYLTTIGAR